MNIFRPFSSKVQEVAHHERTNRHSGTRKRTLGNPGPDQKIQNRTHRKGEDMQNLKRNILSSGQGLVEYILIVGLMGVLAIAAVNALSDKTRSGFNAATDKLGHEFSKFGG